MKIRTLHTRPARIEMLPLIDVVFLLLVVFIYTMLSMAVHRGLPVRLPNSTAAQIDRETTISITVQADGQVFIDKAPVAPDQLTAELQRLAAADQEKGVLLFADRQLSYQRLFRVLDQIRQAGVSRISLQAEPGKAP